MWQNSIVAITTSSKSALKATYLVTRGVAQSKKVFTIMEKLVLLAAVEMYREMIGQKNIIKVNTNNNLLTSPGPKVRRLSAPGLDPVHTEPFS